MDRETIEAMGAGREMDALIACRVMGVYVPEAEPMILQCVRDGKFDKRRAEDDDGNDYEWYPGPRPYSTDIAAAWQVVPALISRGRKVNIEVTVAGCEVTISGTTEDLGSFVEARAATVPLALCGAALLTTLGG